MNMDRKGFLAGALMMASWQLTLPAFESEIMSGFDQTGPAMELLGWNV